MTQTRERLTKRFRDKEYRDAYVESFLGTSIAAQIKTLRDARDWNQKELGVRVNMPQSQVSRLENVNYRSWSVQTLLKLARAFDVALVVRFESFGEILRGIECFGERSLSRPSFADDPVFKHAAKDPAGDVSISATTVIPEDADTEEDHPLSFFADEIGRIDVSPSDLMMQNQPQYIGNSSGVAWVN